jgi:hypothetical protein
MQTIQASVANAAEKKDLLAKLESVVEDKKKNEDALKSHAQELKQQLILMQTKLDRAGELDKDLHDRAPRKSGRIQEDHRWLEE